MPSETQQRTWWRRSLAALPKLDPHPTAVPGSGAPLCPCAACFSASSTPQSSRPASLNRTPSAEDKILPLPYDYNNKKANAALKRRRQSIDTLASDYVPLIGDAQQQQQRQLQYQTAGEGEPRPSEDVVAAATAVDVYSRV